MMQSEQGFREIPHTADWELEAWGPDLPALLEQAARGMYTLAGIRLEPRPRLSRSFDLLAPDAETLLVSFLSELLYAGWQENLAFDDFRLDIQDLHLAATIGGAPIAAQAKEIKAVTYHRLAVRSSQGRLEVNIVFDV